MTKKDQNSLKTLEGNRIKDSVGLSHRITTTKLLLALGINTMEDRLTIMKLSLFERLCRNSYTLSIITQTSSLVKNKFSLITDIRNTLNEPTGTVSTLRRQASISLNNIKLKFKENRNSDEIIELKQLLQLPAINKDEIFEILRCF